MKFKVLLRKKLKGVARGRARRAPRAERESVTSLPDRGRSRPANIEGGRLAGRALSHPFVLRGQNGARLGLRSEQERVRAALGSVRRVRAALGSVRRVRAALGSCAEMCYLSGLGCVGSPKYYVTTYLPAKVFFIDDTNTNNKTQT